VAVTNPADTASAGKIFTISPSIHFSSAFISYWPIAEEIMTDQVVGSSAPTQDLAPASPRAQLASPQLEFQCHQIIQLPLNQLYKNSLPSLKNLLLLLGKPEMM
jgi:hypothetical protein